VAAEPPQPAEVGARKFPCPRCGADMVWHPGDGKVRCAYCGFERAATAEDAAPQQVLERPLEEGLAAPEKVGWGMERHSFRCTRCGAVSTLDAGVAASVCAFCGTPAVVEAPADAELVRPQGVLPFAIERSDALNRFRSWLGSLWFRPNDLKRRAHIDSVRGVYVPFWTFDADTLSQWHAESGTRHGTGNNARIDWRPVSGTLAHKFDDLPVPASRGLDGTLSVKLEPFPTHEMVPYAPDYLSGFTAEEYGTPLDQAWARARARMQATLYAACRHEVPGDLCRNLEVQTSYSKLGYKSGLLPVWIAAYEYNGRAFRYAVNGATGKAAGNAPWSAVKIVLAIGGVLLLLMLLHWLGH
jgi:DNA-directed RNA polymerase subunit RPC12/RpoP